MLLIRALRALATLGSGGDLVGIQGWRVPGCLLWPAGVLDDVDEVAALDAGDEPVQDVGLSVAERGLRPRRDAVGVLPNVLALAASALFDQAVTSRDALSPVTYITRRAHAHA